MNDPLAMLRNPPRRLDISDADYDPALGMNIEIWLDGYEQHKVIAYDCDSGTVHRYKVKGFNQIVVEDGEAVTETVTGDVQVRWRHRP